MHNACIRSGGEGKKKNQKLAQSKSNYELHHAMHRQSVEPKQETAPGRLALSKSEKSGRARMHYHEVYKLKNQETAKANARVEEVVVRMAYIDGCDASLAIA